MNRREEKSTPSLGRKTCWKEPLERCTHKWKSIKLILRKENGCGLDSSGSGLGPDSNDPLGSIKLKEFLD